jgi:hypothetical protein
MRLVKKIFLTAVLIAAGGLEGTPVRSNSIFSFADTKNYLLWRTAPGCTVMLPVPFPEGAAEATLTVSGAYGYTKTYEGITGASCTITLPAAVTEADEDVYYLTLSFDKGESLSASLAVIAGCGKTSSASGRCVHPEGSAKWTRAGLRAVVPVLAGSSVSVGGKTADAGESGDARWLALGPYAAGDEVELTLAAPGGNMSVDLDILPTAKFFMFVR